MIGAIRLTPIAPYISHIALAFAFSLISSAPAPAQPVEFTDAERTAILAARALAAAHAARSQQPRVRQARGHRARADGCSSTRGSPSTAQRSCATCHDPAKAFADGRPPQRRPRAWSTATPSRSPTCASTAGSAGTAPRDSLWAQSIRPILDAQGAGADAERALRSASRGDAVRSPRPTRGVFGTAIAERCAGAGAGQRRQGARGVPGDDRHRPHALRRFPRRARARRSAAIGSLSR